MLKSKKIFVLHGNAKEVWLFGKCLEYAKHFPSYEDSCVVLDDDKVIKRLSVSEI